MNKSLSYGVSSRLARIAPKENLRYGKWEIPAGVRYSPTHLTLLKSMVNSPILQNPSFGNKLRGGREDLFIVMLKHGAHSDGCLLEGMC